MEKHENHETLGIQFENQENHANPRENHENHENLRIPFERIMKIMKILVYHARIMTTMKI